MMQACIHNGGLCDGLGHSLCWQGNVLVYNSQGPGSREHIAGGHPPCQLGTVPMAVVSHIADTRGAWPPWSLPDTDFRLT